MNIMKPGKILYSLKKYITYCKILYYSKSFTIILHQLRRDCSKIIFLIINCILHCNLEWLIIPSSFTCISYSLLESILSLWERNTWYKYIERLTFEAIHLLYHNLWSLLKGILSNKYNKLELFFSFLYFIYRNQSKLDWHITWKIFSPVIVTNPTEYRRNWAVAVNFLKN